VKGFLPNPVILYRPSMFGNIKPLKLIQVSSFSFFLVHLIIGRKFVIMTWYFPSSFNESGNLVFPNLGHCHVKCHLWSFEVLIFWDSAGD